jgi:hypothetical protein
MQRIVIKLPVELADELEESGMGRRIPLVRSDLSIIPLIAIEAAQVATTLISLAQGPTTIRDLAHLISSWKARHEQDPRLPHTTISAEGPSGRVLIDLSGEISVNEIANVLAMATKSSVRKDEGPNASTN